MSEVKKYYRYFDSIHTPYGFDMDGNFTSYPNMAVVKINVVDYPVIKTTPKGVWIETGYQEKKFILNSAKKKFAHPTEELAKAAFAQRKMNQVSILKKQLKKAELALKLAQSETGQTEILLNSFLG